MEDTKTEDTKDAGINYIPEDYTPEEINNTIPGLGIQPFDSGISVRGKVYSGHKTFGTGDFPLSITDIPFTPKTIEIKATSGLNNGLSFGNYINKSSNTLYMKENGDTGATSKLIYLEATSGNKTSVDISKIYNNGFQLDGTTTQLGGEFIYTVYA